MVPVFVEGAEKYVQILSNVRSGQEIDVQQMFLRGMMEGFIQIAYNMVHRTECVISI